jgi:serine/threonine protein phosphatase PrpC
VGGRLSVSRAFGDYDLKMQRDEQGNIHYMDYLTVMPEIRQIEIDHSTDDFIIIGSDGLFEKSTNQELCDYVL